MTLTTEVILPIVTLLLSGGGVFSLWMNQRRDRRKMKDEREKFQETLKLERDKFEQTMQLGRDKHEAELARITRGDDVDRLSAKAALREAADGMAQKIWERLGADLEQAGERLDSAIATIETQRKEIQDLLKRISIVDRELVEAERKLAVAQAEIDRKERVVLQLQEQVAVLEATVTELRQQLAECTGSSD